MALDYKQGQIKLNNLFPNILGILELWIAKIFVKRAYVYQTA
jgi:hypothetical protein